MRIIDTDGNEVVVAEEVVMDDFKYMGAVMVSGVLQTEVDRLEAINAELLESLRAMILATHHRMVVFQLSTEEEAIFARAEAVVARVEGES